MPEVRCLQCSKFFYKSLSELKKSANSYCSKSCAAKRNNTLYPKRKPRLWTEDDLIIAVKNSITYAQVIRKLGLKPGGGTQVTIKKHIQRLNLDITHFKKQGWNKDRRKPFSSLKSTNAVRRVIIEERGLACEQCGLLSWQDQPLTIEMHHKDGNNQNNSRDNLQLLCPNCHSQTDNYRRYAFDN